MPSDRPNRYPLYRPELEHDACGVGLVADLAGAARRDVVTAGPVGARAPDPPRRPGRAGHHRRLRRDDRHSVARPRPPAAARPPRRAALTRALGAFFMPAGAFDEAAPIVERELVRAGASRVDWRPRAGRAGRAGAVARPDARPHIHQALARLRRAGRRASSGRSTAPASPSNARSPHAGVGPVTVVSLSTATVVYKGLVVPSALPRFYADLADPDFESPFIVFHQRFSTNTAADWALAQPFRVAAHNGEINTIAGNRALVPGARGRRQLARRLRRALAGRRRGQRLAVARRGDRPDARARLQPGPRGRRGCCRRRGSATATWPPTRARSTNSSRSSASRGTARRRSSSATAATSAPRSIATASGRPASCGRVDGLVAVASEVGDPRPPARRDRRSRAPRPGADARSSICARRTVLGTAMLRRLLSHKQPYRHLVDARRWCGCRASPAAPRAERLAGDELVRRQIAVRVLARGDRRHPAPDGGRRTRGGRLDGRRHAAGGAVVARPRAARLLPPALRAGHQPADRSVSRGGRDVAAHAPRRARRVSRRDRAAAAAASRSPRRSSRRNSSRR